MLAPSRRFLGLCGLTVALACQANVSLQTPEPAQTTETPPVTVDPPLEVAEAAPVASGLGPFRRETAFLFVPHRDKPRTRLLAKRTRTAALAPDGDTMVQMPCKGPPRLVGPTRKRPRTLSLGDVTQVVFSPDRTRFVARRADGRLTVATLPDGKRAHGFFAGEQPRFISDSVVVFRRGCQTMRMDLASADAVPVAVGADQCGDMLFADTKRVVIAVPRRDTVAGYPGYTAVLEVPMGKGEVGPLVDTGKTALGSPVVSPTGELACFAIEDDDGPVLECSGRTGRPARIGKGVTGPIVFADNGQRLLFAVEAAGARELYIVDFPLKLIRKVSRGAQTKWAFLPGGQRVVGFGAGRGVVWDLETGWEAPLGEQADRWQSVSLAPADPVRFVAAKTRSACSDLYWVSLPP